MFNYQAYKGTMYRMFFEDLMTYAEVAEAFGFSFQYIHQIVKKFGWEIPTVKERHWLKIEKTIPQARDKSYWETIKQGGKLGYRSKREICEFTGLNESDLNFILRELKISVIPPLVNRILLRTRETEDGCLEYEGSRTPYGYGHLSNDVFAHRVIFEFTTGRKLQKGEFVCHHCDNPSCVLPSHLFIGDAKMNAVDRNQKGRGYKLTPTKTRPVEVWKDGVLIGRYDSLNKAAKDIDTGQSSISQYLAGKLKSLKGYEIREIQ